MKKFFVLLLAVLSLGLFVACGDDDSEATVPTFENVSIQAAAKEAGTISMLVTAKEKEATIYYIVVASDAKTPNFEQVKAGVDYDGVTVLVNGTATGTLSKNVVLEEGTVYSVYVILELNGVYSKTVYYNQVLTKTAEQTADKGTGTQEDPFRISTVADLEAMLTGIFAKDAYYKLMNDLDLAEAGYGEGQKSWTPIGKIGDSVVKFAGEFDGDNHTIKNLYINSKDSAEKWGLFAELDTTGVIKNLHLENVNITASGQRVGSVVGYSKGTVTNVSATGTIRGKTSGDADVGGIVGYQYQYGTIRYAYSAVNISAGGRRLGGIVGVSDVAAGDKEAIIISDSYATGSITGYGRDARQVGGIVGYTRGTVIERVYASGDITGSKEVGGLIGFIEQREGNTIVPVLKDSFYMGARITKFDDSSSQIGKLIGNVKTTNGEPQITNNYVSETTELIGGTGGTSSYHGTAIAMDNFKNAEWINTNLKWNFTENWEVKENAMRPTLKGQNDNGNYTVPEVPLIIYYIDFTEGAKTGEVALNVVTSIEADIYYVLVPAEALAPTNDQVIAMENYGEVTLVASGTVKDTQLSVSISDLTEGQEYTVYVVAKAGEEIFAGSKTSKPKAATLQWGGEDPSTLGYYPIYLPSDLVAFSELAATSNTINAKLMQDIDFAGYFEDGSEGFLPIGNSSKKYKGTFDGNNKKISNLYINRTSAKYNGLFGYTDKGATIKDLTIVNANVTGLGYTGILIGQAKADVSNVTIQNGTVTAQDTADSRVGGLIGFFQQGIIDKIYVKATVTGGKQVGVLIGNVDYSTDTPTDEIIVKNIVTEGSATGTEHVGGVAGYLRGTLMNAVSYVTATITSEKASVGAIAGYMQNRHADSQFKATLKNSISFADNVKVIGQVQTDRGDVNIENLYIVGATSPDTNATVVSELTEAWLTENTTFDLQNTFTLDTNKRLIFR